VLKGDHSLSNSWRTIRVQLRQRGVEAIEYIGADRAIL